MLLGAEIGLLVMGLYALVTGKLTLTKQRIVWGPAARLLALIACAPVPLSFAAQRVYAGMLPTRTNLTRDALRWKMIALEAGILVICVAVMYAIGWWITQSSVDEPAAGDKDFPENADVPSIKVAPASSRYGYLLLLGIAVVTFLGGLMISGTWPGMKGSYFAAAMSETADADIDALPPAPPIAGPVPALLLPTPWQPRVEQMVKWNRQSLADAYDKVGKKNPKWDEHAHAAMELTALHFSNGRDPHAQAKDIHAATQKALDAGCDDPLMLYLHVRSADPKTLDAELDLGYAKAATAMKSSAYPPMRRATALLKSAQRKLQRAAEPNVKAEAVQLVDAAVWLLPVSAREDERCKDLEDWWHEVARDAFAAYRQLGFDHQKALRGIDRVLATAKPLEVTRLLLQGEWYIRLAWEARGGGYANTVTAEGDKQFDLCLTLARKALEEAWQPPPHYGKAATFMLSVELGQSRGRDEMEKWFERAIQFDPNVNVCGQKLKWLHPSWHGSTEEMLKFGRVCRDSANWPRAYPLIMLDVHQSIADMLPNDAAKSAYFRKPEVAADILYVLAKSVEFTPGNMELRSRYAYYAYQCGHPRRAHAQFERIGDQLWWGGAFTETLMKQTRANAAKQAR